MGCLELTIQDYFHVREAGKKTAYSRFSRHVPIDPDGNMLTMPQGAEMWAPTWTGENRLATATSSDELTKLEFVYDYMGRRVSKQVYTRTATTEDWTLTTEKKFVYDGFYQIAEFDGSANMLKSYLRVGGEIYAITDSSLSATYFYMMDGNKNVMSLVDASGNVKADYTYDPFGRIIAKTGNYADGNLFQFSSEYFDTETSLVYYNFRYYSPELGRCTKRDPKDDKGFQGLSGIKPPNGIYESEYSFAVNNPVITRDIPGVWWKAHGPLTGDSYAQAYKQGNWPHEITDFTNFITGMLVEYNYKVDSDSDKKSAQQWHFNRPIGSEASSWKSLYKGIIRKNIASFNSTINEKSAQDMTLPKCKKALAYLGYLSHIWQDYYAHGLNDTETITLTIQDTGPYGPFQTTITKKAEVGHIAGSPDNIPTNIVPSSWNGPLSPGEHEWVELGVRAPDTAARMQRARDFVAQKYMDMIPRWWEKCECVLRRQQNNLR